MSSSSAIDFYANAKRFKADMNANTSSDDGSIDGYADRSSTSSPSLLENSSPNSFPHMPLNSITNKLNQVTKPSFDFATAYSGLSSAAQNYYSTPQNYENYANNFQSPHLNPYTNQYNMPSMNQTNQYPIYPNYQNYQNRLMVNSNQNRSSLGTSSSSADSSSISLNSPSHANDENTSPVQHQIQRSNPYNNLGMKESTNQLQQSKPASAATNILNESSSSMSFNLGSDENKGSSNNTSKKRRPVPVDAKDNTYWEKRRKNNESAKRSRDMRRMKEEHISVRVIYLEQENLQLRTENALLRSEVEKLRAMMYTTQN